MKKGKRHLSDEHQDYILLDLVGSGKSYYLREEFTQEELIDLEDYRHNHFGLCRRLSNHIGKAIVIDSLDKAPELLQTVLDWTKPNDLNIILSGNYFERLEEFKKKFNIEVVKFKPLEGKEKENITEVDHAVL